MAEFNYKTVLLQKGLIGDGFDIGEEGADGYAGVQTETAFQEWLDIYQEQEQQEQEEKIILSKDTIPQWPEDNTAALNRFFGTPDFANGLAANTAFVYPPYQMFIAWGAKAPITRFSANKLTINSIQIILQKMLEHYGEEGIKEHGLDQFGGCINVRFARGQNWYSRHCWTAIDLNPAENALNRPWRTGKQGKLITVADKIVIKGKKINEGHKLYFATMPDKVMEIFESQGWTSLSRRVGEDAMHFQPTKQPSGYPFY